MKKYLSFLPVIVLMACTDYQADWENSFSAADAEWRAAELANNNNEIIPVIESNSGSVPVVTSSESVTPVITSSSAVAPVVTSSANVSPVVILSSSATNVVTSSASIVTSSSSKTSSSSSASEYTLNYSFNNTAHTWGWTIYVYSESVGNVTMLQNDAGNYVLQFYPEGELEQEWWLQAIHPVQMTYGKAYQIKINAYPYGSGDSFFVGVQDSTDNYATHVGGVINLDTDMDQYGQWYSTVESYCGDTKAMTFVINGGKGNANGFAVQWVQIEETNGSCP